VSDHEHDALIDEIASELKRPVRYSEGFDARVMAAIRTSHLSVVRGERAPVSAARRRFVLPAGIAGLAAAAALSLMVLRSGPDPVPDSSSIALTPVADTRADERMLLQDVDLAVYLPSAKSVGVMGAFNDWDPSRSPMTREADGTWRIKLRLLPGSYEYQFLSDGATRMTDPSAPATDSEFGEANSVLTVTPRVR
jgi:hypothetical protein